MNKTWLPEEIKGLRLSLGMSQLVFSQRCGFTPVYSCNLEKGVKKPSKILKKLFDSIEHEHEKERG